LRRCQPAIGPSSIFTAIVHVALLISATLITGFISQEKVEGFLSDINLVTFALYSPAVWGVAGNRYTAYAFQMIAASAMALLTDNFRYKLFQFRCLWLITFYAEKLP